MSRRRKRWLYAISGITAGRNHRIGGRSLDFVAALRTLLAGTGRLLPERAVSLRCGTRIPESASAKIFAAEYPLEARQRNTGASRWDRYLYALSRRSGAPQLFSIQKFSFVVDIGSLVSDLKIVDHVQLDGMNINIPPKEDRRPLRSTTGGEQPPQQSTAVLFRQILIHNGKLKILPKDRTKVPLQFDLQQVTLRSAGTGRAMKYDASLTNPKPPGQIHALGEFGPWAADSPGDSPIKGEYTFDHADLGVFKGIAGILSSTGKFEGVLSSIKAKGQARVPDFRLTMAGNPYR